MRQLLYPGVFKAYGFIKAFFYHYFIYFSSLSKIKITSQTTACLFLQGLQLLQVKTQVNSENYFVNVCSTAAETETDYLLLEAFLLFFFFFFFAHPLSAFMTASFSVWVL